MSFALAATLLCDLNAVAAMETAIEQPLRRAEEQRSVSLRRLMPIPDCSDAGDFFEYQGMRCLTDRDDE